MFRRVFSGEGRFELDVEGNRIARGTADISVYVRGSSWGQAVHSLCDSPRPPGICLVT